MNELVFRGYLRPNGQAGVRNIVLVLHTVNCSRHVAAKICAQAREEGIPAELIGNGTCFDEQTVINRMLRLIAHGNVGAVLIVGHGCEFIQAAPLLEFAQSQQKPADVLMDQTLGTETSIVLGMEKIRALWDSVRTLARQPLPVSMLTAGLIGASGGAAAQAVCAFGAALLEQGGSVLISGSGGQPEQQTALLAHTEAGPAQASLRRTLDKAAQFYACNRLAPPVMPYTSLCPIRGVLKLTQAPPRRGLWYLDTLQDSKIETGLAATCLTDEAMDFITAGAQIVLCLLTFGAVSGAVAAPMVSVCTDPEICAEFPNELDCTDMPVLADTVLAVCDGKQTKAEALGISEGRLLACEQAR